MLVSESIAIKGLLRKYSNIRVINICSSDYLYYTTKQPHIFNNVMGPLLDRNNKITNLDMKSGVGVGLQSDGNKLA
jgi:hypothetical protein